MAIIGRPNRNKMLIPNNSDMSSRVSKIHQQVIEAATKKHVVALGIDAPYFAFWRNSGGSIPCSCCHDNSDRSIIPGDTKSPKSNLIYETDIGFAKQAKQKIKIPGSSGIDSNPSTSRVESSIDAAKRLDSHKDLEFEILDDLEADEDFDGLSIFNRKMINCPVCLSSGYTDAWQLHNGIRLVLDTSAYTKFKTNSGLVDWTSKPNKIKFEHYEDDDCSATWICNLPIVWYKLVRFNVWNGSEVVEPELFSLKYSFDGITYKDYTEFYEESETPNREFASIKIIPKAKFSFTHVEIVLSFGPWDKGQLPEVPQAYEDEFIDYQASVSAEVRPDTLVKEGDYVCESKYGKIWKIGQRNQRKTANNSIFGLTLDLKGLQSYETLFKVLTIF